jgi:hypothetical protein
MAMKTQKLRGFQFSLGWIGKIAMIWCVLSLMTAGTASAQHHATEPLLEVPLHRIPKGLTFEDYEDANRRVGLGMFYGLVPGGVHMYAKENTSGWIIRGVAAVGIAAIITASQLRSEEAVENSKYETTEIGGSIYYKVPVGLIAGATGQISYGLEPVPKPKETLTKAGQTVLGLGVATLVGAYLWDIYHGVSVIEQKRDRARFKIGQMLNKQAHNESGKKNKPVVNMSFMVDPRRVAGGLQLQMQF